MGDNRATLSAVITAKDEASSTINQIGSTMALLDAKSKQAASGFGALSDGAGSFIASASRMPESLTKGISALTILGGSASSAGVEIGKSSAKLLQLIPMLSGGAIGAAIAATTVALGVAQRAWVAYQAEATAVSGFMPSLSGTFKMLSEDLAKSQQSVEDLTNEIIYFGKTAKEKSVGILTEQTRAQELNIESNQRMIDSMRQQAKAKEAAYIQAEKYGMALDAEEKAAKADAESLRMQADALEKGNESAREVVTKRYNEITLLEDLIEKESRAVVSTKAKTESDREATKAKEEYARAVAETARQELEFEEALKKTQDAMRDGAMRREFERIDAISKRRRASIDMQADQFESSAKEIDKADDKATQDRIQNINKVAHTFSGPLASAIVDVATKQKSMGEAGKDALTSIGRSALQAAVDFVVSEGIKQLATKITTTTAVVGDATASAADVAASNVQISAASARGAADAISAFAGVPVVGPALGAAQAGVVVGMIEGTRGLMAMADGGVVHGGIPGVDSVPVIGQQGERMLTVKQTNIFDRFVTALERGGANGGSRPVVVNYSVSQSISPSTAEHKRQVRDLMRVAKRGR